MLNTKTIDLIIKTYNENNSIYQAAKIGKVTYQTAKRILINNNIININKPEVIEPEIIEELPIQAQNDTLQSLESHATGIGNGITPYNNNKYNINNINKDNNINNNNIYNKEIENTHSLIENKIDTKKAKYIDQLDKSLNNLFRRYKNDYKLVHPNFLSRDIGIMIDKINVLTGGNNTNIDNRSIIFANFGNNEDMINAINQIKSNKNKLVNR
jgi:hypothetical protein